MSRIDFFSTKNGMYVRYQFSIYVHFFVWDKINIAQVRDMSLMISVSHFARGFLATLGFKKSFFSALLMTYMISALGQSGFCLKLII